MLFLLHAHVQTGATNWTMWCRNSIYPTDSVSHFTNVALYKRVKYFKRYMVISSFCVNLGYQEMQVIREREMVSV